jgi:hypothetical protein
MTFTLNTPPPYATFSNPCKREQESYVMRHNEVKLSLSTETFFPSIFLSLLSCLRQSLKLLLLLCNVRKILVICFMYFASLFCVFFASGNLVCDTVTRIYGGGFPPSLRSSSALCYFHFTRAEKGTPNLSLSLSSRPTN